MTGAVRDDATVHIEDPSEAGAVYGRGFFGTVGSDGLQLDRTESLYLLEMGRLEVRAERGRSIDWADLFRRALRAEPGFGIRYLVYRDLRQRGYVVRAGPAPVAFSVLPRGGVLQKTPARFWVDTVSEREPFDLHRIQALADKAQSTKKQLLVGVVDEESDLTYYRIRRPNPTGALPPLGSARPIPAMLGEDRVLVFDPTGVESLGRQQAYGSRIGSRLELSLLEAVYLVSTDVLELRDARSRRPVSLERLERRARRLEAGFGERLSVYRALRDRQLVVKTGFKYGAHFRAYPRNPEHAHARYLVHAVEEMFQAPWSEIARGVRVAQGVRKEFLLAGVSDDRSRTVRFLSLERIRP
ncbi:MAG: tRNA-intron lyase [Thermoplasmata archaeon]|nr:tRNA-intron lyase [Thermoplasmata archaeon]